MLASAGIDIAEIADIAETTTEIGEIVVDEAAAVARASVESLLGSLRAAGHRITAGRRAIVETIVAAPSHVTAEDIVTAVQARHPELHASTVYRTLESLEEAGLVEHVHLGHGPARWQLANSRDHHLVCEACGSVVLVPRSVFDDVRGKVRAEFGFEIALQHFATVGRCVHCTAG